MIGHYDEAQDFHLGMMGRDGFDLIHDHFPQWGMNWNNHLPFLYFRKVYGWNL